MAEKPSLKKICSILVVLLFILLGFNIFQYQRNRELINKPGSDSNANEETIPASNNESKSVHPGESENYDAKRISELEGQLHATEEDLDIAASQLSEELSKKEDYKELLNSTKPFSTPSDQKKIKKIIYRNSN